MQNERSDSSVNVTGFTFPQLDHLVNKFYACESEYQGQVLL
jgi:hypothetical protein